MNTSKNKSDATFTILSLIAFFCCLITFFCFKKYVNISPIVSFFIYLLVISIPFIATLIFHKIKTRGFLNDQYQAMSRGIQVKDINEMGFHIYRKDKWEFFSWDRIDLVQFSDDYKTVNINAENEELTITSDSSNWFAFIKKVPSRFTSFDFEYVNRIFKGLLSCEVCGSIALHENHCYECGSKSYDSDVHTEFKSKQEYIRHNQFDLFSIELITGDFKGFYIQSETFSFDKNWKPVITENELEEYCKTIRETPKNEDI